MGFREGHIGWLALGLAIVLAGCVTTEERPDGRTVVRFSAAGTPGNTSADPSPQGSTPTRPAPPAAPTLATTSLAGFFVKHPFDGTAKTYFPRVALTITDWSRNDCWVARARIWWSASKAESVAPFSVCFDKQSLEFNGTTRADRDVFERQIAIQTTGNVRTEGSTPPMMASLDQHPMDAIRSQQTFPYFLQQIIVETGWKGGAPTNFWVVGYDSKAVAAQADKVRASPIGAAQRRDLENALSCRLTTTLDASLKSVGIPVTGDAAPAPDGLTVFGLPVAKVAFNRESGEVFHAAYFAPGVSLQKVAAAAKLRADKGDFYRQVTVAKGVRGFLTASVQNGISFLKCSVDFEQETE